MDRRAEAVRGGEYPRRDAVRHQAPAGQGDASAGLRRSLDDPVELAYYIATGPRRTTLTRLAKTAGAGWSIEGAFESAKQEVGLVDYEVRSWGGWHRHVTLSLLTHAIMAAVRRLAGEPPQTRGGGPRVDPAVIAEKSADCWCRYSGAARSTSRTC